MLVNVANETYSVYVTPEGGSEQLLASSYAFRAEQASTSALTNVAMYSLAGGAAVSNVNIGSVPVELAPATPSVQATAASTTEIDVSWAPGSNNATGFVIQRSTDGTNFTTIAQVDGDVTSYQDLGLNAGTQYEYTVRAVNDVGFSGWSNVVTVSTDTANNGGGGGGGGGGMPNASNTGPTTSNLTPSGGMTITTAGTVISNLAINGTVYVEAPNVTIRNCSINAGGNQYGVQVIGGTSSTSSNSVKVENCTITNASAAGIYGNDWSADACNIYDMGADATDGGWNNSLTNSFIHDLGLAAGAHADGFQTWNGQNVTIEGNNFDEGWHVNSPTYGTEKVNSCVFLEPSMGPVSNVTVKNNWFNGGNYAVYCAGDANVSVISNVFAPYGQNAASSPNGEQYGYIYQGTISATVWQGNTNTSGNAI